MFHQRLFASGSNVPLRFQLPLIFLPRVTKERRGKKGRGYIRDVHVRRAFPRLSPLRIVRALLPSGWNSIRVNGDLEEYSRQQGVRGCKVVNLRPLIETMSKEGNDNAVLVIRGTKSLSRPFLLPSSLSPRFLFFSLLLVPLVRSRAYRSLASAKEFVARHRGERYSVSVAFQTTPPRSRVTVAPDACLQRVFPFFAWDGLL